MCSNKKSNRILVNQGQNIFRTGFRPPTKDNRDTVQRLAPAKLKCYNIFHRTFYTHNFEKETRGIKKYYLIVF